MNVEAPASRPRVPRQEVEALIEYARASLGLTKTRPWRLISWKCKFRKILFEVEEIWNGRPRLLVGKVSDSKRAQTAFGTLETLWQAGFRPPAECTVVEPVAWLPARHLLIQEKAPGRQLLDGLAGEDPGDQLQLARRAARWLIALQSSGIEAKIAVSGHHDIERNGNELAAAGVPERSRLLQLTQAVSAALEDAEQSFRAPSHGDYHPMNVFLTAGRVTVIDVDTFAARDPLYDVGYFVAQAALFGRHEYGSFAATAGLRAAFLREYENQTGRKSDPRRLAAYVAAAFLRSLHFDLCILRTGNNGLIAPYLAVAERSLEQGAPVIEDQ